VAFSDFIKKRCSVVSVEDIIDNGDIALTDNFGINDHSALVEKFEACGIFNEELSKKQLKNLAKYFKKLPSEVAMKLWYSLTASGGDIQNVVALHPLIKPELVGMLTDLEEQEEELTELKED
jgi:hypothetical protein